MRVTTNSIVRNYNANLTQVMIDRNKAGEKVNTHRQFMKSSEDPAAANRAAQLHRQYLKNQDYISTVEKTQDLLASMEGAMASIETVASQVLGDYTLSAMNGTNAAQRETYANTFDQIMKSMMQFVNTTYNDKYLFSGQHTDQAPFTIAADGTVSYLGLDVNDPANMTNLDDLSKESIYVDIGLGISTTVVSDANAFDTSTPAIGFMGYGVNDKGIPKNLIALTGAMAEELRKGDAFDSDRYNEMLGQFKSSYDNLVDSKAMLGVQSKYLDTSLQRLKDMDVTYNEQILNVEYVDDAAAISDYTYAQYAYNAALRVGTSLLSASLLDFLN